MKTTKNNQDSTHYTTEDTQMLRPWLSWVASLGLLLVMVGTALPLTLTQWVGTKYIYTLGALTVVIAQLFMPYRGKILRVKRLVRIEMWSGIFFCVGAFLQFYHGYGIGPTDWLAFTLAGAIIRIYTSILIPRAIRKATTA